tara:strand:+ start:374 stop:478 length:105 start_codon:yes stop_codon:yes gene_type:complete
MRAKAPAAKIRMRAKAPAENQRKKQMKEKKNLDY